LWDLHVDFHFFGVIMIDISLYPLWPWHSSYDLDCAASFLAYIHNRDTTGHPNLWRSHTLDIVSVQ